METWSIINLSDDSRVALRSAGMTALVHAGAFDFTSL